MRITRKGAGAVALGLGVAIVAGACGGAAGAADVPAAPVVPGVAAEDGAADLAVEYPVSIIGEAQRVGAMESFNVGDTFVASSPLSIDLLYRVHPGYPVSDDWLVWSAFEANNNVTFNRTDVLMADWEDRRNLLIATGEFPTLVPVVWPGQQNAWATGGALLAASDYFGYMPHLMHFLAEWDVAGELENQRAADGNIYIFPGLRQAPNIEHAFAINVDIFEAAGITEDPATFEELAEQLRAVQATGLVDFAFSDRWTDSAPLGAAFNFVGPNFDTQGGWGLSTVRWNADQDAFIGTALADGYRDMVGFFAGLVADGTMDPDITQDDDSAIEKFINGRSAMISTNFQQMDATLRTAAAEAGLDLNVRMMTVPAGTQSSIAGSQVGPGFVLNASVASDPNFLATLQFIDWILYSEEGREFAQWGVRGETFDVDATGNRFYLDNIGGAGASFLNPNWASFDGDTRALNATFGFQDGVWMNTWGGSNELVQSVMPDEQRAWVASMADSKDIIPSSPAAPLTEMESEEAGMLSTAINDMVHAETARFVLGIRPMSEWDAFRAQLQGAGIDRVVELHNAALARARG